MNTFTYSYPVKVYFGEKAAAGNLSGELAKVGSNVLLAYGVGSVKKVGIYDELMEILKAAGKTVTDYRYHVQSDLTDTIQRPRRHWSLSARRWIRNQHIWESR